MTTLDPIFRGDTFESSFTLTGDWTQADLAAVTFTLRTSVPASSVVSDDDAVDQATLAGEEIEFDEDGITGTITIPASRTNGWPVGKLVWDLQVETDETPARVYTIDSGTILIRGDVTRSTS